MELTDKRLKYIYKPNSDYSSDEKGIESIMTMPTPKNANDILTKIIADRLYFIREEINEISKQIEERQELSQSLDSEIDERVSQVKNIIYFIELDICNKIDKSRRRTLLEKQIAELYKEKRQEKLSHWTDTVMLKRELRKAKKEERSAVLDLWMTRFLS